MGLGLGKAAAGHAHVAAGRHDRFPSTDGDTMGDSSSLGAGIGPVGESRRVGPIPNGWDGGGSAWSSSHHGAGTGSGSESAGAGSGSQHIVSQPPMGDAATNVHSGGTNGTTTGVSPTSGDATRSSTMRPFTPRDDDDPDAHHDEIDKGAESRGRASCGRAATAPAHRRGHPPVVTVPEHGHGRDFAPLPSTLVRPPRGYMGGPGVTSAMMPGSDMSILLGPDGAAAATRMQRTAVQAARKRVAGEQRRRARRGSLPLSLKERKGVVDAAAVMVRQEQEKAKAKARARARARAGAIAMVVAAGEVTVHEIVQGPVHGTVQGTNESAPRGASRESGWSGGQVVSLSLEEGLRGALHGSAALGRHEPHRVSGGQGN